MNHLRKYMFAAALVCMATWFGCVSSDEITPSTDFDRQAMLANYADNLIIPGYLSFKAETNEMEIAISAFLSSPTTASLASARKEYQEAYLAWQVVSTYEFGPADEQMLRNSLNIFPATTSQIESNITTGSYNLTTTANLSAKGFPALDYLLYGAVNEAAVVEQFTTASNAGNRKKYLQDLTTLIKQAAEATYAGWTSGTTAKNFKESGGTAVGSSVGNLVNQFNFEADLTKRAKLGIPAGKFTAGAVQPERVEAYYSGTSLALLERNLKAQKALFVGQSATGSNGLGLEDYLNHVDSAKKYKGLTLSEAILTQYDAALAALAAVPGPLSQAVKTNLPAVNKVYEELQKLIVLTKTDLPAALGVTISYTDNDGD